MPQNAFAIAILNYNGLEHLKSYLPKLIQYSQADADIYLIDNASTDESVAFVSQNHPEVKLVINHQNFGYAGGYNQGLKHIDAQYYLLVNSDIEPTQNWIQPLRIAFEKQANLGALQPKILDLKVRDRFEHAGAAGGFVDFLGYPFCRGRLLETCELDSGQYDDYQECFWASGACMAVSKEAFDRAGGFDADFFAHMEEIDLCWRMKRLGYIIAVEPQSVVYHLGGGTLSYRNPRKTYLNFRNNLLMMAKNIESSFWPFILFFRMILDGLAGALFMLRGDAHYTWAVARAHGGFYHLLPKVLKFRRNFKAQNKVYPNQLFFKSIVFQYFVLKNKTFSSLFGSGK